MLRCGVDNFVDIRQGADSNRLRNPDRALDHHRVHAGDDGHQVQSERRAETQTAAAVKDTKQTHKDPQINLDLIPRSRDAPEPPGGLKTHERH